MPEIRSLTGPAVALAGGRVPPEISPARRRWTLALAGLGAFMSALDVVVVATALPTMRTHLGASLADLEWTINAYNLALGCLMLTGAALGDRFGRAACTSSAWWCSPQARSWPRCHPGLACSSRRGSCRAPAGPCWYR